MTVIWSKELISLNVIQYEPIIEFNDNYKIVFEGHDPAPWANDPANKALWWSGGDEMTGFYYSFDDVNHKMWVQYGKNASGWAGTRFFIIDYSDMAEIVNPDNSVNFELEIDVQLIASYRTDFYIAGVPVHNDFYIGNYKIAEYTGLTGDNYSLTPSPNPLYINVTLLPNHYTTHETSIKMDNIYTAGTYPNATMTVGMRYSNPLMPGYKPGAVYKNGDFKAINAGGFQKSFKNGDFQELPMLNISSMNQPNSGHTRVFKNGDYKQAKKY